MQAACAREHSIPRNLLPTLLFKPSLVLTVPIISLSVSWSSPLDLARLGDDPCAQFTGFLTNTSVTPIFRMSSLLSAPCSLKCKLDKKVLNW